MKIGIYGYGNLGKGCEWGASRLSGYEVAGVFTKRDPREIKTLFPKTPVFPAEDVEKHKNEIDAMLICSGSSTSLPEISPYLAEYFNIVDSFDTHSSIKDHFRRVDAASKAGGKIAVISAGWDPGIFSLFRGLFTNLFPEGNTVTYWGPGVSQGHSEAIRSLEGVIDARQYTLPVKEDTDAVRRGERDSVRHKRVCYVVTKDGANREKIEKSIVTMPGYFEGYETEVNFVTAEELYEKYSVLSHGGGVISTGSVGEDGSCRAEISLSLGSNPQFTARVMLLYASAAKKLCDMGESGCRTVADIPPAYIFREKYMI